MDKGRGLWHGKSTESKEWVEGYFAGYFANVPHILRADNGALEEVISETLGECAGIYDKNRKLIFEGDVINIYYLREFLNRSYVTYEKGCFWPERIYGGEIDLMETLFDYNCECDIEIIGNIHDNPALLKGDGNG